MIAKNVIKELFSLLFWTILTAIFLFVIFHIADHGKHKCEDSDRNIITNEIITDHDSTEILRIP